MMTGTLLLAQSYQNMEADGVFTQYPIGSDGQVLGRGSQLIFARACDKDKFENTAWTVNGKIGDLKAVYTGGYLDPSLDQTKDYSNYARSAYGFYYTCTAAPAAAASAPAAAGQCGSAAGRHAARLLFAHHLLARPGDATPTRATSSG